MITKSPLVTVLMPTFNIEAYVDQAIQSILRQTFGDFEFLIVDDGSSDETAMVIRQYKDKRIRFIGNKKHKGLVPVLNQGLDLARGKYLARMDGDDISLPTRLEKQVDFMNTHPKIGVSGTWLEIFGPGRKNKIYPKPTSPAAARATLLFSDPVHHGTVIMRLDLLRRHHLRYDPSFKHLEDYEFWNRISQYLDFCNLNEVLYLYRYHDRRSSHVFRKEQQEQMKRIQTIYLKKLGVKAVEEYIDLHARIIDRKFPPSRDFLEKARLWLGGIITANERASQYDANELRKIIANRWFNTCQTSSTLGLRVAAQYWNFPWAALELPKIGYLTFLLRCVKASLTNNVDIN